MKSFTLINNQNTVQSESEEVIEHSFSSNEELLHTIMQQKTVFEAIRLAEEINEINDYKVITDYDMKIIKDSYRNGNAKIKTIISKGENEFTEIKISEFKDSFSKNEISDKEKAKIKMKELQKGYMKMLSL